MADAQDLGSCSLYESGGSSPLLGTTFNMNGETLYSEGIDVPQQRVFLGPYNAVLNRHIALERAVTVGPYEIREAFPVDLVYIQQKTEPELLVSTNLLPGYASLDHHEIFHQFRAKNPTIHLDPFIRTWLAINTRNQSLLILQKEYRAVFDPRLDGFESLKRRYGLYDIKRVCRPEDVTPGVTAFVTIPQFDTLISELNTLRKASRSK